MPGWIGSWDVMRAWALKRDAHKCRVCGRGRTMMVDLHVHHLDWCRKNNDDANLMTLCRFCHKRIHMVYRHAMPPI